MLVAGAAVAVALVLAGVIVTLNVVQANAAAAEAEREPLETHLVHTLGVEGVAFADLGRVHEEQHLVLDAGGLLDERDLIPTDDAQPRGERTLRFGRWAALQKGCPFLVLEDA